MKTILKRSVLFVLGLVLLIYIVAAITMPRGINPSQYSSLSDNFEVEIIRDKWGVPHIYGRTDPDVAFGLAFANAQDDFATIQDVLLATRGLMSTKLGIDGIPTDFLVKFMNGYNEVEKHYQDKLSPKVRAIAEAYADGINHYLSVHGDDEEISPYLLPVTGLDVVAGYPFKTPLFYGFDKVLGAVYDGSYGQKSYDNYGNGLALYRDPINNHRTRSHKFQPFALARNNSPQLGSQGIAIAPSRSGGETLLLVNSHQPLTGPVAWYEARVKSEQGWDMVGGTFPGAPVILHGAGKYLGWSSTVNKPDLSDVYRLEVNPDDSNEYKVDGAWQRFETRTFDITVHFLGPIRWTFEEDIKLSIFGPVLETDDGVFALNWAGRNEIRGLEAHYAMNRAKNLSEFENAIKLGVLPSINYVVADREGQIAHYYNAMFPNRKENDIDWSGIIDGTSSSVAWQGYLPFSAMPKTVNPSSGAVYNANNTPFEATDGEDGYARSQLNQYIGIEHQMTNRAVRIKRLLSASETIDFEVFRQIKYDTYYDKDSDVMNALFSFLNSSESERVPTGMQEYSDAYNEGILLLRNWDLNTNLDNSAAGLGVLTVMPYIQAELRDNNPPPIQDSFANAVKHLIDHFGQVNPAYADVNKLYRGGASWAMDGGPDIVRAVYGYPPNEKGELVNVAGDSYILFARWDETGNFSATSVHSFGTATLDESSPHFADQSPLFVNKKEKHIEMDRAKLMETATSVTSFGSYLYSSK